MTNQSNIPGMDHGMFFEHYIFSPLNNFVEADLYHIANFFNIVFDDDVEPPHARHFDGMTFTPPYVHRGEK